MELQASHNYSFLIKTTEIIFFFLALQAHEGQIKTFPTPFMPGERGSGHFN